MAKRPKAGERGHVLPLVLMVVVLLSVLTPGLLFLSGTGFLQSKHNSFNYQARYLADAAYQSTLQVINRYAQQPGSTPPFPLTVSDEKVILDAIKGEHTSTDTTDGGTYAVVELPGSPQTVNGQRVYHLQAIGKVGSATSTIDFTLIFSSNSPQIVVPRGGFLNVPKNLQSYVVYDDHAQDYAQSQQNALLTGPSYTPNVTCANCTAKQIQQSIQSHLNLDPLVIKVVTLTFNNNDSVSFSRPDTKRLVILADRIQMDNNSALTVQGTLISNNDVSLSNNTSLHVKGDLIAHGDVSFGNNSVVTVSGQLISLNGSLSMNNNATCNVSGSLAVRGSLSFKNNSTVTVYGWLSGNDISVDNNGTVNGLGGTAIVTTFKLDNNATYMFNGRVIVGQTITLQNNAVMKPGSGSGGSGGTNVMFVGVEKL